MRQTDAVVVGAGIVGLATSLALLERRPGTPLVVLEKEDRLALHQTGRNSGVIHAGLYYKPGSLKAINCRQGKKLMEEFTRLKQGYEDSARREIARAVASVKANEKSAEEVCASFALGLLKDFEQVLPAAASKP